MIESEDISNRLMMRDTKQNFHGSVTHVLRKAYGLATFSEFLNGSYEIN